MKDFYRFIGIDQLDDGVKNLLAAFRTIYKNIPLQSEFWDWIDQNTDQTGMPILI
jgi:hypothetical protein